MTCRTNDAQLLVGVERMTGRYTGRRSQPTQEEIARLAYDIFVRRGSTHGHDVEDWLEAERELCHHYVDAELRAECARVPTPVREPLYNPRSAL